MISNTIKTVLLLTCLSGLFLLIGMFIGGRDGLQIAFIMAVVMNFIAYFFSESIVLRLYRAQRLDQARYQAIYTTVQELAASMNIPMPKLWLVSLPIANAFATGRNPKNASVVLTTGILGLLDHDELRGVLAHELAHVKNRDILVTTIAATLATAIGYLAHMMQYAVLWGTVQQNNSSRNRSNPLAMMAVAIIMPIAATLLQLALSRSREYLADESGAHYSHEPLALASALAKIANYKQYVSARDTIEATTSPLFIINPLAGTSWMALFSTHPPVEQRIKRLQNMAHTKF